MSGPKPLDPAHGPLIPPGQLLKNKRESAVSAPALQPVIAAGGPELPAPVPRYERPAVIKAVALGHAFERRKLMIASLAAGAEACGSADVEINTEDGQCTCHAVCTCDLDDDSHDSESIRESTYDGEVCTCNAVCSCDTVCTCDTVSSGGDSGGGYSTTYWY